MTEKILIVDDDVKLLELLQKYLTQFQYQVLTCTNAAACHRIRLSESPALIILDIMMPGVDGLTLLKSIRQDSEVPIIMLSARGEVSDRIVGLELGADDYLGKPFEPRELQARIQSILRRDKKATLADIIEFKDLSIRTTSHQVFINSLEVELTTSEYEVLLLFAKNPGKVYTRDHIMDHLRGIEWASFDRSIDVLISRLRHKLDDSAKSPRFLKTIWGTGYKFIAKKES